MLGDEEYQPIRGGWIFSQKSRPFARLREREKSIEQLKISALVCISPLCNRSRDLAVLQKNYPYKIGQRPQSQPTGLTSILLKLFELRPPLEFKPPPEKRKCTSLTGMVQFVSRFAEPEDPEFAPPVKRLKLLRHFLRN